MTEDSPRSEVRCPTNNQRRTEERIPTSCRVGTDFADGDRGTESVQFRVHIINRITTAPMINTVHQAVPSVLDSRTKIVLLTANPIAVERSSWR